MALIDLLIMTQGEKTELLKRAKEIREKGEAKKLNALRPKPSLKTSAVSNAISLMGAGSGMANAQGVANSALLPGELGLTERRRIPLADDALDKVVDATLRLGDRINEVVDSGLGESNPIKELQAKKAVFREQAVLVSRPKLQEVSEVSVESQSRVSVMSKLNKAETRTKEKEDQEEGGGGACDTSDQIAGDGSICGGRAATVKRGGKSPIGAAFYSADRKAGVKIIKGVDRIQNILNPQKELKL